MTKIFNPLDTPQKPVSDAKLSSESKAMDNNDPSVCPKCGNGMVLQGICPKEQVHFCTRCRVSSPQLVG